ncbi:P-loop containing nucleoside triphosphate hydrolase protein [Schizothecium vesticola]|uniref:P-loop containing nucleoside triphosphate hydrolase protein n=1 Tax=Schizothecium vesticola TaxID=314040 RepID=A0AA40F7D1_9PEZI|nr:P-loop containing nucleoside triphosphate hydrolase protein [Schizothecium vesticola]
MMDKQDVSEKLWKWRYKLQHLGQSSDKTLADFSDTETETSQKKPKKLGASSTTTPPSAGLEPGSSLAIKTLYEGPNSHDGCFEWVDYPPKQLSKSVAKAHDRVAIRVFKIKDKDKPVISGRHSLRYHQIEVQSPLLVGALAEILAKQNMHLDVLDTATFSHPFRELYFAYDDILAKCRALEADKEPAPLRPFVQLLVRLLDDMFSGTRTKLKQLLADRLVSFQLAWALFPKGTTVVAWGNNCELLCKVDDAAYRTVGVRKELLVTTKVLRFNGSGFLWDDYEISIPSFSGNQPIAELPAYPLEFFDGRAETVARLTARGRRVLDYQGLAYASYQGIAIYQEGGKARKHNVDGRVLIDVMGYNKHHLAQGAREGTDPHTTKQNLLVGSDPSPATPKGLLPLPTGGTATTTTASERTPGTLQRLSEAAQARNKAALLALEAAEPHLMYMLPLIEGYALKNKLWVSFFVEDIRPMTWNAEAFDHLVYDEQQKDLVMSFVENHGQTRKKAALEDVIVGKGAGLIILLSGPPGTGKTLMAEAVADRTRKPLFYLQAEDLGISAAVLGANIKKVFEMATEWDAVVLLDEADVFMAERHPQDIARNELVSIFLRELEYFRGIIFLTTNLYSTIDTAFRSRVSLHLLFKSLTVEARGVVWKKFLERLPAPEKEGEGGLDDEDVKELAAWQLNGREIKTAVKMTRSWCDHKGYGLTLARMENGIRVTSPHATKAAREGEVDTSLYDE